MTTVSESLNHSSTAGLVAQPVHRRFISDMRRQVIPPALLRYPALAALEEQRRRLVQALEDAESSGPEVVSDAAYVAQRTKALREGTDLPPAPPTTADLTAGREARARDVQAATDALLALGDDICQALRQHPEWEAEGREHIAGLRKQAEEARRKAAEAERQADDARFLVQWMERAAHDELYVVTTP